MSKSKITEIRKKTKEKDTNMRVILCSLIKELIFNKNLTQRSAAKLIKADRADVGRIVKLHTDKYAIKRLCRYAIALL